MSSFFLRPIALPLVTLLLSSAATIWGQPTHSECAIPAGLEDSFSFASSDHERSLHVSFSDRQQTATLIAWNAQGASTHGPATAYALRNASFGCVSIRGKARGRDNEQSQWLCGDLEVTFAEQMDTASARGTLRGETGQVFVDAAVRAVGREETVGAAGQQIEPGVETLTALGSAQYGTQRRGRADGALFSSLFGTLRFQNAPAELLNTITLTTLFDTSRRTPSPFSCCEAKMRRNNDASTYSSAATGLYRQNDGSMFRKLFVTIAFSATYDCKKTEQPLPCVVKFQVQPVVENGELVVPLVDGKKPVTTKIDEWVTQNGALKCPQDKDSVDNDARITYRWAGTYASDKNAAGTLKLRITAFAGKGDEQSVRGFTFSIDVETDGCCKEPTTKNEKWEDVPKPQ